MSNPQEETKIESPIPRSRPKNWEWIRDYGLLGILLAMIGIALGSTMGLGNKIDGLRDKIDGLRTELRQEIRENRQEIQKNREAIQKNKEELIWARYTLEGMKKSEAKP